MTGHCLLGSTRVVFGLCLITALCVSPAQAAKEIRCTKDDIRFEIDVAKLAIEYRATGLEATLGGLSVLSARVAVEPKILQQAAVATQKLNEFIKALATGYNSCAISKQDYAEGIKGLLPAMQTDGKTLESLRQQLLDDQKVDAKRLETTLASFNNRLERLAILSGKRIDYERIGSIVDEQLGKHTETIQQGQKIMMDEIRDRFNQLEQRSKETPLPTPQQVKTEISAIKQQLLAKADEAEAAYNQGYELLERYRFAEALPLLEKALAAVKLPDFYLAVGRAYSELPDLVQAEHILREGLGQVDEASTPEAFANLSNQLGLVLLAKGDLDGALAYAQRALKIDEKVFGPEHPNVGRDANNIGQILKDKGDLDGALAYAQRALKIDEKVFGPEHPKVAIRANNIGQILKDKGDLDGALAYAQRALKIDEKVFGPEHPNVGRDANNIGQILKDKGDLDGALAYAQRALKIDEKVFGPEHPKVAIRANNIGQILQDKGDLDGALAYAQRALKIDEKVFGPEHPNVGRDANNIGLILKDKGDLDGALAYAQRALKIDEKVFGPEHPNVAVMVNNIGLILKAKGDLDGALAYAQRALKIDEKVFGPEHPNVAVMVNNIGLILQDKGDLDGALAYAQRALKIDEKVFGPEHPNVGRDANNIGQILQDKGDLDGALAYAQRALKIFTETYGPDNPSTKTVAKNIEYIKSKMRK